MALNKNIIPDLKLTIKLKKIEGSLLIFFPHKPNLYIADSKYKTLTGD